MPKKSDKGHRNKKNPRSQEAYQKEREQRNRSRGKQVWVGGLIRDGGHWTRISVDSPARAEN